MDDGQKASLDHARLIRSKLERRELPFERAERMWAGCGSGELCAGCDRPISRSEVEYELDFHSSSKLGVTIRFHPSCCDLWDMERIASDTVEGCGAGPPEVIKSYKVFA